MTIKEIEELIEYTETTHIYSMSKITAAFNQLTNSNAKTTTCLTCLIRRFREIKRAYGKLIENNISNNETKVPALENTEKPKKVGRPRKKKEEG